MTRATRAAFLAIVSIALDLHAQAPVPQATFRAGTDLVQVDVSVLDGKRHPVRGLRAGDFTIFEDDQPREIQAFTEVYLPDRVQGRDASWMREVPSDVVTNQAAQDEGRLIIIVLDRTIPVGEPTITARRIAAAAINQLGPADLAAVVSTSNGAVQNLTSDRSRLLRAISGSDLSTDISVEAKEIEASCARRDVHGGGSRKPDDSLARSVGPHGRQPGLAFTLLQVLRCSIGFCWVLQGSMLKTENLVEPQNLVEPRGTLQNPVERVTEFT
jgi:hypothetical protein